MGGLFAYMLFFQGQYLYQCNISIIRYGGCLIESVRAMYYTEIELKELLCYAVK